MLWNSDKLPERLQTEPNPRKPHMGSLAGKVLESYHTTVWMSCKIWVFISATMYLWWHWESHKYRRPDYYALMYRVPRVYLEKPKWWVEIAEPYVHFAQSTCINVEFSAIIYEWAIVKEIGQGCTVVVVKMAHFQRFVQYLENTGISRYTSTRCGSSWW